MSEKIGEVGCHRKVEILDGKDINERIMVKCCICGTLAHAYDKDQAVRDLKQTSCAPTCINCHNLRTSGETKPAIPINGTCNDRLHVCPSDGNRWWQSNDYFHFWQQVTNDQEWEGLNKEH